MHLKIDGILNDIPCRFMKRRKSHLMNMEFEKRHYSLVNSAEPLELASKNCMGVHEGKKQFRCDINDYEYISNSKDDLEHHSLLIHK